MDNFKLSLDTHISVESDACLADDRINLNPIIQFVLSQVLKSITSSLFWFQDEISFFCLIFIQPNFQAFPVNAYMTNRVKIVLNDNSTNEQFKVRKVNTVFLQHVSVLQLKILLHKIHTLIIKVLYTLRIINTIYFTCIVCLIIYE